MFKTLLRGCKQCQIILKKQKIDPAVSNSDILVYSVETVYPLHFGTMKWSDDKNTLVGA